jgi:hypothetical protein
MQVLADPANAEVYARTIFIINYGAIHSAPCRGP